MPNPARGRMAGLLRQNPLVAQPLDEEISSTLLQAGAHSDHVFDRRTKATLPVETKADICRNSAADELAVKCDPKLRLDDCTAPAVQFRMEAGVPWIRKWIREVQPRRAVP